MPIAQMKGAAQQIVWRAASDPVCGFSSSDNLYDSPIFTLQQIMMPQHRASCGENGHFFTAGQCCPQPAVFAHFIRQNELRKNIVAMIDFIIERQHDSKTIQNESQ